MICPAMLSAGLMNWAEAEFVADAVFGAHQFGAGKVRDFESLIGLGRTQDLIGFAGDMVGDVGFVRDMDAVRCRFLNIRDFR